MPENKLRGSPIKPEITMNDPSTSENSAPAKPQPRITSCAEYYWQQAGQNKLTMPYCRQCDKVFYYPRHWCPSCFNQDLGWQQVSGRGKVYSYSVIYQSPFPSYQADIPYVLAIIELEEGPRMMTNVVNCDAEHVRVDMAVQVTFERRGAMKIPQFEPR